MQHQLVIALGLILIAVAVVGVGVIFLHWLALGLTVGSAAANQFLLHALAVAAVLAAVAAAGWSWLRKRQHRP